MKVLVLEDDATRIDAFREALKEHIVTIVSTSKKAVALLCRDKYDAIYLDNDLGNDAGVGTDVVAYLCGSRRVITYMRDTKVIVHSWNVPASRAMVASLEDVGYRACLWRFDPKNFLLPD